MAGRRRALPRAARFDAVSPARPESRISHGPGVDDAAVKEFAGRRPLHLPRQSGAGREGESPIKVVESFRSEIGGSASEAFRLLYPPPQTGEEKTKTYLEDLLDRHLMRDLLTVGDGEGLEAQKLQQV